jgi:hypothetical protein
MCDRSKTVSGLIMDKEIIDNILANYHKFPGETGPGFPGVIPWWRLRASEQIKLALEIKFG